jgi:beta-phosphoglucomutase family hydrolase
VAGEPGRAVLWDMDGVIVDSGAFHERSWQETFWSIGVNFTDGDFRRAFGMRNEEIIRSVLGEGLTEERFETIARLKEESFRRLIRGHMKALPGVKDLLAGLEAAGVLQGLVSSTPMENIELITGSLGIRGYFKVVLSGNDVTEGKPSPQGYLLAARRLGVKPANCVVIEDAVAGVQAAKSGGMKCIAVTNTRAASDLGEADLVVDSLEKVTVEEIERMLAPGGGRTQKS